MIYAHHSIDPVIRDLNRYLADQEQHDIRLEHIQAKAEQEFHQLDYIEIVEYQSDYRDLKTLFEFVQCGKLEEAKSALRNFLFTVKDTYIENRTHEIEQEEEKERLEDQHIDLYFLDAKWC